MDAAGEGLSVQFKISAFKLILGYGLMMGMAGFGTLAAGFRALLAMIVLVHSAFFGTHAAYFFAQH
ncbi:hypothetical protein GCM10007352_19970 [Mucilaginibacter phyllosphaerae]|nr:hypothetical protein GCM10007352_19970 [Mucilaginibacter phyllosphaerae]